MDSLSMGVFRSVILGIAILQHPLAWGAGGKPLIAQQAPNPNSTLVDVESLRTLALQEGESGKTAEAIRDYKLVLEIQPTWKEGWWNLGTLQYSSNQFTEAASTFRRVLEFAQDLGLAWSLLGLSEFETKDFSNSLLHLEKANSIGLSDDPETQRVSNYHLAMLLVLNSEFERATDLLVKTFGGGPVSPEVKFVLGLAMLRVPLLPWAVDPSQEALVLTAGDIAAAGDESLQRFPEFLRSNPDVPYARYAYGLALAKAGRDKESMDLMYQEAKISPESPLPWIEIARLQLRMHALKQAHAAAQKAVALDSGNTQGHKMMADILEAEGEAKAAAQESAKETSLNHGKRAPEERIVLRYGGKSPSARPGSDSQENQERWNKAMEEFVKGQYSSAAADLKEWLGTNPANGTGWAVLGLSEFAMKQYDNAKIHLERGQSLGLGGSAESLQSARYTLGILLIRSGEFDSATDLLMTALKMGPLDAKVEYALGMALLRVKRLPEEIVPPQNGLYSVAGSIAVLLQESKYDTAFLQFKALLQQYPSVPFLHYAYGTAFLAVSQFDEAAAEMRAELLISPSSELPCVRLASIALRQHKAADAIPWAKRALDLAPNSAEAHYLLGRASLESGDDATAIRELEIASKISPGSPEIHFNLAKAYARARMPEKAERERATFSQLNQRSEVERSQHGSQIYSGPHDARDVTSAPPP
jgi:tetratricopeptide (TPR) repeat protein